jgi:hypothetical protein
MRSCRLPLLLLFVLVAALSRVLFRFLEPRFFVRSRLRGLLSGFEGFLLRLLACLFFASFVFFRRALGLLFLGALSLLLALFGFDFFQFFLSLPVQRFLFFLCLLFEHIALYISALAAHLDIDSPRAALCAGQPQLRLRLALQRNFAWRTGDR